MKKQILLVFCFLLITFVNLSVASDSPVVIIGSEGKPETQFIQKKSFWRSFFKRNPQKKNKNSLTDQSQPKTEDIRRPTKSDKKIVKSEDGIIHTSGSYHKLNEGEGSVFQTFESSKKLGESEDDAIQTFASYQESAASQSQVDDHSKNNEELEFINSEEFADKVNKEMLERKEEAEKVVALAKKSKRILTNRNLDQTQKYFANVCKQYSELSEDMYLGSLMAEPTSEQAKFLISIGALDSFVQDKLYEIRNNLFRVELNMGLIKDKIKKIKMKAEEAAKEAQRKAAKEAQRKAAKEKKLEKKQRSGRGKFLNCMKL